MDAKTFHNELRAIEDETRNKIVALVQKAQADDQLTWDTDKSLNFVDDPNWQRAADSLAELAGWIYDRVNGRNWKSKKSVTKKIRKALGYTYP